MNKLGLRFITLLLLAAPVFAPALAAQQDATRPLLLAVHPYLPSNEIRQHFAPLAAYLGKVVGRPIEIRIGRNYEEHIDAIGTNAVDIAFIGPAPYVAMVSKYGSKPLLARIAPKGRPVLDGVIITRKDSPLRSIADLHGKRFAFGDIESTMASIVPRYFLQEAGVPLTALASYQNLASHKNVALGVLAGDFDAGAVKTEVFKELEPRGLRVLATLPTVSEHLFVTRADMPAAQIYALRQALLKLKNEPDGLAIMHALHKDMTEMVPVIDADYQNLRKILTSIGEIQR